MTRSHLHTVALLLAPPLLMLAAWVGMRHAPVVPGVSGCRFLASQASVEACITMRAGKLVEGSGLQTALEAVDAAASKHTDIAASCHAAWHPLGEDEGKRSARTGSAYSQQPAVSNCQQGWAHGYVSGWMLEADASVIATSDFPTLCAGDSDAALLREQARAGRELREFAACTHGLGHALVRQPGTTERAAVSTCSALAPDPLTDSGTVLLTNCFAGVFMERAFAVSDLKELDRDCGSVTIGMAREVCSRYLVQNVLSLGGDMRDGAIACGDAPPRLQRDCTDGFARATVTPSQCDMLAQPALQRHCLDVRPDTGVVPDAA